MSNADIIDLLSPLVLLLAIGCATDSLNQSQALCNGDILSSNNGRFHMGFFTGNSNRRYLAIKCNGVPHMVWIANRENLLLDSTGSLNLSAEGGLAIYRSNSQLIQQLWKSNTPHPVTVQLLDTGNLVARDLVTNLTLWQCFDYLSDSVLPMMKVGMYLRTNYSCNFSSWIGADDPSSEEFNYDLWWAARGRWLNLEVRGAKKLLDSINATVDRKFIAAMPSMPMPMRPSTGAALVVLLSLISFFIFVFFTTIICICIKARDESS